MKALKVSLMLVLPVVFSLTCTSSIFAEICNRIVAIVNSEVITYHELNKRMKELTGLEPIELESRDHESFVETRKNILNMMIDEKISSEKIQELGIQVTPKEIDAAIENIKARNHWTHEDLVAGLNNEGMSYEMYREKVKKELEQMRLIDFEVKSKIIISDESIKKYYEEHIDEFVSEEKVRLGIIVLLKNDPQDHKDTSSLSRKAAELVSRLNSGEDFSALARTYSQGPGADEGGDLGFFNPTQLDPKLNKIINNMSAGDISGPIMIPGGIQIIKVLEKQEKGVKPIEKVKDEIRNVLYVEEISRRFSSWIEELRGQAYIKITF